MVSSFLGAALLGAFSLRRSSPNSTTFARLHEASGASGPSTGRHGALVVARNEGRRSRDLSAKLRNDFDRVQ